MEKPKFTEYPSLVPNQTVRSKDNSGVKALGKHAAFIQGPLAIWELVVRITLNVLPALDQKPLSTVRTGEEGTEMVSSWRKKKQEKFNESESSTTSGRLERGCLFLICSR